MNRFKKAIQTTKSISTAYCSDLKALSKADRSRILNPNRVKITGSIDLDTTLKKAYPNSNRWDYGIGVVRENGESIIWVEVHPGTSGEVDTIIKKSEWLRWWLKTTGGLLMDLTSTVFIWISSGSTAFTSSSPQAKKLATKGLKNVGGRYNLL